MTALRLRPATGDDLPAIAVADGRAFGMQFSDVDLEDFRPLFQPERFLLACDTGDGAILGITGDFPFDVTVPGGTTFPVPGVTWVAVAATHRRRGILRALLTEQHRGFVADGVAVSLLTASESGIYGRFGYGTATVDRAVEIDRRRVEFRSGSPDPGGVRYVESDELRVLAPEIHRRWVAATPGALSRSAAWWDNHLLDREHRRGGGSALFHLVHPDGYVSYRRMHTEPSCRITEMVTTSTDAHAALWRVLLGLDLVGTIAAPHLPLDDPLPLLLTDPRQVRTTGLRDGMWARVLDVPAALGARRYGVELDVTLRVHDAFLDLGGCFRLRGGPDGATCEPGGGAGPVVDVDVAALGALLFGGTRVRTLAGAGMLASDDPAALGRVDVAFLGDRLPEHGTHF